MTEWKVPGSGPEGHKNIESYLKDGCVEYLLAVDGGVGIGMKGGERNHPVYGS